MPSDDSFREALDKLTARLQRDIARHLDSAVEELTAKAETLALTEDRSRAEAIDEAATRARDEAERATAERLATLEADHILKIDVASSEAWARAERETAERLTAAFEVAHAQAIRDTLEEAEFEASERLKAAQAETEAHARATFQRADLEAGGRLISAFRAMDSGQSLSEILSALVSAAAAETRRVALFLMQNARFRSLRLAGFDARADADAIDVPAAESGLLAAAAAARAAVTSDTANQAPAFAALPPTRRALAVPLVVNAEVAALLYADEGVEGDVPRESWQAIIEVLTRHASRALEAFTAQRLAKTLADRSGSGSRPPAAASPLASPQSLPTVGAAASIGQPLLGPRG